MANWKLSPSDFAFLWEECKRCFYLKIVKGVRRPFAPFPKMFSKIDGIQKNFFSGKSSLAISSNLPPGKIKFGDKWVESRSISIPGSENRCYIRGITDSIIQFDDGSYGIIDFKTTEPRDDHIALYSRQLHAYAFALENPAEGNLKLSPISKLGIVCIDHQSMDFDRYNNVIYRCSKTWIEFQRNNDVFLDFIKKIVNLLSSPRVPDPSDNCEYCNYRHLDV